MRHFRFARRTIQWKLIFERGWRSDPITVAVASILGAGAGFGISSAISSGQEKASSPAATMESSPTTTGAVNTVESVEAQSAQRRLARLSKYFTSPTGVLDSSTGSTGVF